MKKVIFVISLLSTFLLFSCASKNTAETDSVLEAPELSEKNISKEDIKPEIDNQSDFESAKNTENEIENTENQEQETTEIISEDISNEINPEEQILEEIEEPEIIELEPPAEISEELTVSEDDPQTAETENNVELVSEEDLITPEIDSELADISSNNLEIDEDIVIIESQDNDEVENLLEETETTDELSITEDSVDEISEEENEEPDPEETKLIIPSRSMTVKKHEYIDITYPGKGWVFMGLTDNSKSLTYLGRKIGTNDTKFTLQARNSGTYVLHFYKNDSVTNEYLDDYLEIIILDEKNTEKTHVEAPKYVPLLPEKKKAYIEKINAEKENSENTELNNKEVLPVEVVSPVKEEKQQVSKPVEQKEQTNIKAEPEVKEQSSVPTQPEQIEETIPDTNLLYEEAMLAYKSNDITTAEKKLLFGLEYATTNKDKYLFWLGQIYEKESPIQNINKAIEEYTLLINNYPASSYWDKANKRIIYLKRFYIEGR